MLMPSQQHEANRPRFSIKLCFGMDRVKQRQEKRKASFQRLRNAYRSNTELAETLGDGFSDSYVSQLLRGHRGIGDDVADKIESRLGLDHGWLDRDHSTPADAQSPLVTRYQQADAATRTLIDIALMRPDEPLPDGLSPTLRALVAMARTAIANDIEPNGHP